MKDKSASLKNEKDQKEVSKHKVSKPLPYQLF
jgi:hypothetical protein